MIVHIPFIASVKLKAVILRSLPVAESPSMVKVYVNRDDVDFTSVDTTMPTQEWALVRDAPDVVEYATR